MKSKRCGNCNNFERALGTIGDCIIHHVIVRTNQTCCFPNDYKPLKAKERRHAKD